MADDADITAERAEGRGFFDFVREPSILHDEAHWLVEILEYVAAGIDFLAILILLIGGLRFIVGFVRAELSFRDDMRRVRIIDGERIELGRYILSGLELLIVADVIHTALSLAMADLVYLGVLVIVRSIISFFLDRELAEVKEEMRREDEP